jgi:hypothetical protein
MTSICPVLYSEHLTGDGREMFEHAAKLGWEGCYLEAYGCAIPVRTI